MRGSLDLKSFEESALHEIKNHEGETRRVHHFFGTASSEVGPRPQGFLVEMPPENTGRPHFHAVDQFQLFFGVGAARYQRHEMGPVMVHYSDAYTTYGPFSSGSETLQFFTLRAHTNHVTAYMPQDRDQLVHKGHRGYHHSIPEPGAPGPGVVSEQDIIGQEPDRLRAVLIAAGPGAEFAGPSPQGSSGQYYCVIDGGVRRDGRVYRKLSLGWCEPEADQPLFIADPVEGASVVVMQFPSPSSAPLPS